MSASQRIPCDRPFRETITRESSIRAWRAQARWFGPWWFDRSTLTLNLVDEHNDAPRYQFRLVERTSNDVALAWQVRFSEQAWATPEQLGWLTFALNRLVPPKEGKADPRQRLGGLGWI